MAQNPHGYSGKPLFMKLGLKPGMRCLPIDPPRPYPQIICGAEGVALVDAGPAELVHLFCADQAALAAGIASALDAADAGGMFWISWPKKSSKLFCDLTEDGIRAAVLPTGWVDVKVCAVDADWSALKFLRRKT